MNLDKLVKQLRRDLAANPKKAAALGLMVVVALYFWGPLVWGWVSPGDGKQKRNAAAANLILTDDPLALSDKSKLRSKPKFRWEKVRPLLAQDPRMASARFDEVWLDPFGAPAAAEQEPESAEPEGAHGAVTAASAPPASATEAGLTLTTVAIGAKRRAATISGESYAVGDELVVRSKDGTAPGPTFRVAKITPQGVELHGQGTIIVLPLARSRLATGDTIVRSPAGNDH